MQKLDSIGDFWVKAPRGEGLMILLAGRVGQGHWGGGGLVGQKETNVLQLLVNGSVPAVLSTSRPYGSPGSWGSMQCALLYGAVHRE